MCEKAGFESFGPGATPNHEAVRRVACELRIFFGSVIDGVDPGVITIAPPMSGGAIDATVVHDAVLAEAHKADNRTKLGSSAVAERHLAVYVDPANHRVWVPLVDLAPLESVVALPAEVTHVWAISEDRAEHRYVVWRAKDGAVWERLEIGGIDPGTRGVEQPGKIGAG